MNPFVIECCLIILVEVIYLLFLILPFNHKIKNSTAKPLPTN